MMADLPENIDSAYVDDATHPDVKLHQEHHDALHWLYNRFKVSDYATWPNGGVPFFNLATHKLEIIDPDIAGSPGPTGNDGHGFRWRGAWDNGTAYTIWNGTAIFEDDVVFYNGSTYIALAAHTGSTPPAPASAPSANWDLLVRQGTDGVAGTAGQGLTWRGAWNSGTNYAAYDLVSYLGSTYVALATNTNSQPPSADWSLVAERGDDGVAGAAAISEKVFTFPGEVAEVTGTLPWAPAADIVVDSVRLTASHAPDVDPVVANLVVNGDPDATWDTSGGYPTLASGAIISPLYVPDHASIAAGLPVTVDIFDCGAPSGAGSIVYRDYAVAIDNNSYTSRAIPIPAGYYVGDTLLTFVCHLAASGTAGISGLPGTWAQVPAANELNAGPNQMWLGLIGKVAGSGEGAGQNVSFGVTGKVVMITVAIGGMADIAGTYYDDIDSVVQDTQVSSVALPAILTTLTDQLGLWCYCLRHTNGEQQLITMDGSLTQIDSVTTTSGAGNTNIAMAVGRKALATATTYGSLTASDTSQTGRWAGRVVALKVTTDTSTPGEDVSATIAYHRAVP